MKTGHVMQKSEENLVCTILEIQGRSRMNSRRQKLTWGQVVMTLCRIDRDLDAVAVLSMGNREDGTGPCTTAQLGKGR